MFKKTETIVERDLVVVGGGPAGMAGAAAAAQSGVQDILLLERDQYLGGILNQCIHNGFGLHYFKEELTGPEYAARFISQVTQIPEIEVSLKSLVVDLRIIWRANKPGDSDPVYELTYLKPGALERIRCRSLIMATGCRERTREMIHIPGDRPAGIFPAGLAQKLINLEGLLPGQEVVIIGSGDIGLIMARRFILEGARVKAIIEVQNQSRGLIRNLVQCVEDFEIPMYFQHQVSKIYGKNRVEGVEVSGPQKKFKISCDTVLISVGLIPENELIEAAGVAIDKKFNAPILNESDNFFIFAGKDAPSKPLPNLFVCGNAFKVYDLVDSVTTESIQAGQKAAEYLRGLVS